MRHLGSLRGFLFLTTLQSCQAVVSAQNILVFQLVGILALYQ